MSTINLLSCSARCFTRTSLSQTVRKVTGCFSTGVINFNRNFSSGYSQNILTYPINHQLRSQTGKPFVSIYEFTKCCSNAYGTNPQGKQEILAASPDDRKIRNNKNDQKVQDKKDERNVKSDREIRDTSNVKKIPHVENIEEMIFGKTSDLSQFAKLKLMYKKYWYVLIPVHVVTSVSWIAGFYYLSKSGVDIPSMLQHIHLSESVIEKVRHSDMGHYAIAYLCYKVITPIRYAVSLGMTTVSIKRLVLAGYIKPIPTKQEIINMYSKKKANRAKRRDEGKDSGEAKTS